MITEKLKEKLLSMGYTVKVFDTKKDATEYLTYTLKGESVGFGGSMTLTEMGLYEKLCDQGCEVFWHWKPQDGRTQNETRALAGNAKVYISSANALSENGEIINIDGTGNRLSECLYGHEKVFFVIGQNKIAEDYDSALYRARNVASPKNAQRMNRKTPCAKDGNKCYDCNSPERICRALSVLWTKPMGCEYEIILVKEDLGY
ncbi:MAG: lactate utilization protein [Eubacteriaceae bacterium]|nr:lactate utilization protein [Eubacteriaceae bacterium]